MNYKSLLEIESTGYYPLVYIPKSIREIGSKNFYEISEEQIRRDSTFQSKIPVKPDREEINKRAGVVSPFGSLEPVKGSYYKAVARKKYFRPGFYNIIWILPAVVIYGNFVFFSDDPGDGTGPFLFAASCFGLIYIFYKYFGKYYIEDYVKLSENEKLKLDLDFETKHREYKNKVAFAEKLYSDAMRSWTMKYNSLVEDYKRNFLNNKYLNLITASKFAVRSNGQIKKGKLEDLFLKHLVEEFGESIKINMALETQSSQYFPDFVYESKQYNFCIDIEIDERYEKESNTPIHFIGADDDRDNFFLKNNWFVIRFAEEQIKNDSGGCIEVLKNAIARIENPHVRHEHILRGGINTVKRWTYEEIYIENQRRK